MASVEPLDIFCPAATQFIPKAVFLERMRFLLRPSSCCPGGETAVFMVVYLNLLQA
jgi:hypothetical protein